MFEVRFKEQTLSFDAPVTVYDAARQLGPVSHDVLCARVNGRTGDLTAVCLFLEKQLGFLFLAPGPLGVSFPETPVLTLTTGRDSWDPGRLVMRSLRWDYGRFRSSGQQRILPEFYKKKAKSDYARRDLETRRWLKQMRMGRSVSCPYGHAFTQWWKLYGKTHPEYFALHKGKRAPWGTPPTSRCAFPIRAS